MPPNNCSPWGELAHEMKRHDERALNDERRKGRLLALLARLQHLPEEFPDVDDTLLPLDDVEV